jgi:O-antigen ligase
MLYAVMVFFLLQSMGALSIIDRSIYGTWYGKEGDKITQLLNSLSLLAALVLFYFGTRASRVRRFNRILPLAVPSILLISALWSVDPRTTHTQGVQYLFVVLGTIGLVESTDNDDMLMELLAWICTLSAIASIVQFFVFPEPGDFRGIFLQKNVLGQVMAGGVLAGLHGVRIGGGRRFRYICAVALCAVVCLMSKSGTSIATVVTFFGLDVLGRLYLRGGLSRTISLCLPIVAIPIVILLLMNLDSILEFFGKDPTLTGRTEIWPYVVDSISQKPILGWGFSAFWSPLNPVAGQIDAAVRGNNWFTLQIPNSHNTLLELLLGIGIVGTSLFLFLWVRYFVLAMKCMNGPAPHLGLSLVLLLVGILSIGANEVVLLSAGQIWTNLFFMMGFICEKRLWLARATFRQGRPPPRHGQRLRQQEAFTIDAKPMRRQI